MNDIWFHIVRILVVTIEDQDALLRCILSDIFQTLEKHECRKLKTSLEIW